MEEYSRQDIQSAYRQGQNDNGNKWAKLALLAFAIWLFGSFLASGCDKIFGG